MGFIQKFIKDVMPDLKEHEGAFREFYLHSTMSMLLVAGIFVFIANMAMIYMDFGFAQGDRDKFLFSVSMRAAFSLFTMGVLIVSQWKPSPRKVEIVAFIWVFAAAAYFLFINYLRPANHLTTSVDILFIFSVYVFFGFRLKWLCLTMVLFSIISVALTLFMKSDVLPTVRAMTAGVHILVQVVGLLAALQIQSFRRKAFLAYVNEKDASESATRLLQMDPLTGCFSRRHFFDMAERELERAKRYGRPFCVIMMDLDRFKNVNDQYGHLMGDRVLKAFSKLVTEQKRWSDVLGRLGGEEFSLLLPETDLESAQKVADRIQDAWAQTAISVSGLVINSTVSTGTAVLMEVNQTFEEILHRADISMYEQKGEHHDAVH